MDGILVMKLKSQIFDCIVNIEVNTKKKNDLLRQLQKELAKEKDGQRTELHDTSADK